MLKTKIQDDLYSYCRWNDTEEVINILQQSNDIDILYENGRLFDFALSEDNYAIVQSLLKYFEEKYLNKYAVGSKERINLNDTLTEILKNVIDGLELSTEMKQVLSLYVNLEDNTEVSSRKSDFSQDHVQYNSDESTQPTSGDEHSLLSESNLSQLTIEGSHDIKELKVYNAIKALQSVYTKENDNLSINIARDFGVHAGDGNATHVRVWHGNVQKIIDIDSSMSAEMKGVHLSLHSIIKDVMSSPDAIICGLDGHEKHVNLSGCEYEYFGEEL